MSGGDSLNINGIYGTKGVPSGNNFPGGRNGHSMVFHPSMNCMFLFGGYGYATSTFGLFIPNDD